MEFRQKMLIYDNIMNKKGPVITESQLDFIHGKVLESVSDKQGGRLLTGGSRRVDDEFAKGEPFFLSIMLLHKKEEESHLSFIYQS